MMFGKFLTGALYTSLVGGAVLFHEGAITVSVREHRPGREPQRVFVVAPAVVVPWALRLIPEHHAPRLPQEAREALPALQAAAERLEAMPDFVMVEVESPREKVKVSKDGGYLVIDVSSEREEVHVSVPLRAARHTLETLLERSTPR
jgi:hypothetical protein